MVVMKEGCGGVDFLPSVRILFFHTSAVPSIPVDCVLIYIPVNETSTRPISSASRLELSYV